MTLANRQVPVQETQQPHIDPHIDLHSDSEDAWEPSSDDAELMSELPAMTPIRFNEDGEGSDDQQYYVGIDNITHELDALPGYHRDINNRSSSVCPRQFIVYNNNNNRLLKTYEPQLGLQILQ